MDRYAQLVDNVVHMVIESDTDPDGINGEWIQVSNEVGPGFSMMAQTLPLRPHLPQLSMMLLPILI